MTKAQMEEKIARLENKCHALEKQNHEYVEGARDIGRIVDATMAQLCLTYGTEVYSDVKPPEAAKIIGYRLEFKMPDLETPVKIHSEKRDDRMIIGYMVEEN